MNVLLQSLVQIKSLNRRTHELFSFVVYLSRPVIGGKGKVGRRNRGVDDENYKWSGPRPKDT